MTVAERDTLRTGIELLDRKLGGGIPTGSVAALAASPASQSELFLYEIATTRQTVYLTTIRAEDAVATVLEDRGIDPDGVDVIRVDDEDPLGHARSVIADLPDGVTLIVDPVDVLESGAGTQYRRFLADMKERATGTTSVVVLHCLRDEPTPVHRRDTMHLADLVFQLSTEVSGDSVVNRLTVPKFRTGQSIEEVIKLDMTAEIEVDLSRNIL